MVPCIEENGQIEGAIPFIEELIKKKPAIIFLQIIRNEQENKM